MKIRNLLTMVFLAAICVLLTMCGDTIIENYYGPEPDVSDTDGDGLTDEEELSTYMTSPILADTDGDGLSDYEECVEYSFDPDNNPYKYNPLVADIPKLGINITSPPSVSLHLTDTSGVSRTFETSRSDESAQTVTTSTTDTNTHSIEMTHTASIEFGFSGWSVTGKVGYSFSNATTDETSYSYSEEQSNENRRTLTNAEAFERASEVSASGGILMTTVEIENRGNVAFRLENLILGAVVPDTMDPGVFYPVGNLTLEAPYTEFPEVSITPGDKLGVLNFINDGLDLETAKSLLRDARSLVLRPASYEITDGEGKPFAFNLEEVQAKTATVIIDYAGHRSPERYMVATNLNPEHNGVSAGTIFGDYLLIPYTAGETVYEGIPMRGLVGVRGISVNEGNNAYWLVVHSFFNGLEMVTTPYDLLVEDYNFNEIELKAGHVLHLTYVEDLDGDEIYSREEFLRGTGDESLDSDGDGITDAVEVENGTDPGNADTDGDHLNDLIDPDPLQRNNYGISTAGEHTILLKADGTLWAWGLNDYGQLGLGDTDNRDIPTLVGSSTEWDQISIGNGHSLARKINGTIWAWGLNYSGQLGTGDNTDYHAPNQVGSDWDWVGITAGHLTSFAIRENGTLWAWGENGFGQLGDNTQDDKLVPTLIGSGSDNWLNVSGGIHTLAVKGDGTLWACGPNNDGQLGLGDTANRSVPTQVGEESDWISVSAGYYHSLGLKTDGTLWAWGSNEYGELGIGVTGGNIKTPYAIGTGWKQVAAGMQYSLGIRTNGTLWAWGRNNFGELGLGDTDIRSIPIQVGNDSDWVYVAAPSYPYYSRKMSVAIKEDGSVWAWGRNDIGQIGNGNTDDQLVPTQVSNILP
jgi:alpha-tubulin suppressor-like RCC1 family protein